MARATDPPAGTDATGGDVLPVYVLHWNRPAWCAQVIAALRASRDVTLDVTLIDNGSTSPASSAGTDRVITLPVNIGYTGAANRALHEWMSTSAEFCLIATHDLVVEPTTVAALLAVARSAPSAAALNPDFSGTEHTSDGGAITHETDQVAWRTWISGAGMLLRRDSTQQIGDFDEEYGSYYEDVDYCFRARARGWQVGTVKGARAAGLGSTGAHKPFGPVNSVVFAMKHGGPGAVRRARVTLLKSAAAKLARRNVRGAYLHAIAVPLSVVRLRQLRRRSD